VRRRTSRSRIRGVGDSGCETPRAVPLTRSMVMGKVSQKDRVCFGHPRGATADGSKVSSSATCLRMRPAVPDFAKGSVFAYRKISLGTYRHRCGMSWLAGRGRCGRGRMCGEDLSPILIEKAYPSRRSGLQRRARRHCNPREYAPGGAPSQPLAVPVPSVPRC
jgi:hypothetical protein